MNTENDDSMEKQQKREMPFNEQSSKPTNTKTQSID